MAVYIIERISGPSRNLDGSQNLKRDLSDVVHTNGSFPVTTDRFTSGQVDLDDIEMYGGSVKAYLDYFHFVYTEDQLDKLHQLLIDEWEKLYG